uniref:Uncharacterized protein n=1 Tax=Photinus pyralis TaxID=7054 RepID=A0A1Y1M6K3_PHOPY
MVVLYEIPDDTAIKGKILVLGLAYMEGTPLEQRDPVQLGQMKFNSSLSTSKGRRDYYRFPHRSRNLTRVVVIVPNQGSKPSESLGEGGTFFKSNLQHSKVNCKSDSQLCAP